MINKNIIFISLFFLMFVVANVNAGWTTNSSERSYYFIEHDESGDPLATGSIWLNGSFSNTTFYVYYDGSSAGSYADGDKVFEFFDDFDYPNNALNTTKWTCVDNTCAVSNSIGSQAAPATSGTYGMRTNSVYDKNDNFHFYCKIQQANYGFFGTQIRDVGGAGRFDMKRYGYNSDGGGWITATYDSTASNNLQNKVSATGFADYFKAEMRQYATSYVEFYHNGNLINNHTAKIPLTDGYFFIMGLNGKYVYCDWLFNSLRNTYTTSYGSEESGSWEIDGITYTKRKEVEMTGTFDGQIELNYNQFNSTNVTVTTYSGIDVITIVSPTTTEYLEQNILINITDNTYEERSHFFVVGQTASQVKKYDYNLNLEQSGTDYGEDFYRTIRANDDYIYVAGSTKRTVRKYHKSNLTDLIDETPNYGGVITSIEVDDDYVYVVGLLQKIKKYDINNMSNMVLESSSVGTAILTGDIDDNYVYIGGLSQNIKRYYKSNLTFVDETPSYGGDIYAVVVDDDYIYMGGLVTQTIQKYEKVNMSNKVDESASYAGNIFELHVDEEGYIYVGGSTNQKIRKYHTNDLTDLLAESSSTGGSIYTIRTNHDYVYSGGFTQKLSKYHKSNLTYITESGDYGGVIRGIHIDNYNYTEVDNIWYNWNGTNVTYTTPVTVTFPAGEHTLFAWANNTSGYEQELKVTFDVYLNPDPASFNHLVQLVRNDDNVTLSWTLGTDLYPLSNQTLYIFDNSNNLVANYSLSNTTTSYNYTNNITNVYYAIVETCNIYPLCTNSTSSKKFSFQSIEFVDWPTLVTSLETYNIKFISSATNVERINFTGSVCPLYSNPVCQVINGVETNKTNDCFACSCQPTTTYYYNGACGVGNSSNITYCSSEICGKEIIVRDNVQYYTTYINPYYQSSFTTTLYENQTYSFKALNYYKLEGVTLGIETDIKNLTIYNFSIGLCSDASGFINYTLVDESEGLMTGDIGTFIRIHQPLGDINATLNMSSDNHLQYCITPKKNYTLSSDIYYIADAIGRTEEYYLKDAVYDTTLNNILYLYNLNNTDILNVIVLDEYSTKKVGSVVNLIKFYPNTMYSKTIASAKTNSEGEVNFFYDRNDQIKLTVVEDGITEYEDSEFNKYYSVTGYYSRTVKLGSGIIPSIDNIVFNCFTSIDNATYNKVECEFESTDGQQHNFSLWVYDHGFNYIDILNESYSNTTSYQLEYVYTSSGSLEISSAVLSGLYEFKIDGITRKTGVLNFNPSAVPIEIKYLTLPFVFLVLILGAINPFFALGGFFILGLFADPTTSTFMFFDNNFILGSVVAIIIAFVIEEVKAVTKKR